jgi:hypothetical protein
MGLFREPERIKTNKISKEGLPGLQPLKDEVFLYLLEQALSGKLFVYFAAVPFNLIEPFDKEYNPKLHPIGAAAIKTTMDLWLNNQFTNCWVYPKNNKFILSDDYIPYFAAIEGQPDYLPCFVLGDPNIEGVVDIKGPLTVDSIKKHLWG